MMFSVYRLLSRVRMRSHVKGELVDHPFLADRTNGRAYMYATVLRLSSSVTLCIVAKRCVLEQKLLLRAYRNRLVPK